MSHHPHKTMEQYKLQVRVKELDYLLGDEMVCTRVVFLLLSEKVNTCEESILSLAIYGLVYLRGNWLYLSPKLLLNPIPARRNKILSREKLRN
jgi:hypothetical protein